MSKVWFVTGSSRPGRASSRSHSKRVIGAATARNPERMRDLHDKYGDAVLLLRLDVTDYAAAARVVTQAGRRSVVIVSSSTTRVRRPGSFEDTTIDSFRAQIDTDFYGVVNVRSGGAGPTRAGQWSHFPGRLAHFRLSGQGLTAYQAAKCAVAGSPSVSPRDRAVGVKVTVLEPARCHRLGGTSMTIPQPSGRTSRRSERSPRRCAPSLS